MVKKYAAAVRWKGEKENEPYLLATVYVPEFGRDRVGLYNTPIEAIRAGKQTMMGRHEGECISVNLEAILAKLDSSQFVELFTEP